MVEDKNDELARAFATLSSLRKNIGQIATDHVLETYVIEYHAVLDRLEGIGIGVAEFRIPDSEVKPKVTSVVSYIRGGESHVSYSEEKYVQRSFILTKIDAILGYFEIITSKKPRTIGFSPPDTKQNDIEK